MKKRVVILGSTGSIGSQALEIIRQQPSHFEVVGLAAGKNIDLLEKQIAEFSPRILSIGDEEGYQRIKKKYPQLDVHFGDEGLDILASYQETDLVLVSVVGFRGLRPTLTAIREKKIVAIANKEALVAGGAIVMEEVRRHRGVLLPIDSEHSGIFQCLQGEDIKKVSRILLTASGGPFRSWSSENLKNITLEDALKHPTWSMGMKNSIDSSNLMNKGLEVIEAYWLFNIEIDRIAVVIHPQSVVHAIVEFCDGSMIAQMSKPDMRLSIHYALHYPGRMERKFEPFDFGTLSRLDFFPPDEKKFPCLRLSFEALKKGGTLPCFMSAANEVLVERFGRKEIGWQMIGEKLETLMEEHHSKEKFSLEDLILVDREAREVAHGI
jgi:1-deoxy-D-xylulose-5-phosphate reductoisomerase